MVKRKVYLVCGVSGSGKSWVCSQLTDKFNYVPHDRYRDNLVNICALTKDQRHILTECPFAERLLREEFERQGFEVLPYFVIETPETCAERYLRREGRAIQPSAYTRASTIMNRAIEWDAPFGTSEMILKALKEVKC